MFEALQIPLDEPIRVLSDSESAIALTTHGEAQHKGSKHFEVKLHSTRDRVDRNEIQVKYIPSDENLADFLTKPLSNDQFLEVLGEVGLSTTEVCLDHV